MFTELNDENFDQEVLSIQGLVMVDFWAVWCGPCRSLAPIVGEIADECADKVKVCKFDIESGTEIPSRFGIMAVPTILFFKNGEIVDKFTGVVPKSRLIAKIDSLQ